MAAVPLPWCTSRSTTAACPASRSRRTTNGDRHVVEHAEALAVTGESMMEPTAQVDGRAVAAIERQPRRRHSAAGHDAEPLDHRRRAGNLEPGHGLMAQSAVTQRRRDSRAVASARSAHDAASGATNAPGATRPRRVSGSATSVVLARSGKRAARNRGDIAASRRRDRQLIARPGLHAAWAGALPAWVPARAPAQRQRQHLVDGRHEVHGEIRRAAPASRSSLTFFSFCCGRMISRIAGALGGQHLFLDAADRQHLPDSVISPVIATSPRTGRPVSSDASAVAMVTPADGPSFGNGARGHVHVDLGALEEVRIDAAIRARAHAATTARRAPTPSSRRRAGRSASASRCRPSARPR